MNCLRVTCLVVAKNTTLWWLHTGGILQRRIIRWAHDGWVTYLWARVPVVAELVAQPNPFRWGPHASTA